MKRGQHTNTNTNNQATTRRKLWPLLVTFLAAMAAVFWPTEDEPK
jgi:hypothetical protein